MFGFACDERPGPDARDALLQSQDPDGDGQGPPQRRGAFLEPDAKSQVTLPFEDGKPAKATAIVVSTAAQARLRPRRQARSRAPRHAEDVVALRDAAANHRATETVYHINPDRQPPDRRPAMPTLGVTGRKIIVDTDGGAAPQAAAPFARTEHTLNEEMAAASSVYAPR